MESGEAFNDTSAHQKWKVFNKLIYTDDSERVGVENHCCLMKSWEPSVRNLIDLCPTNVFMQGLYVSNGGNFRRSLRRTLNNNVKLMLNVAFEMWSQNIQHTSLMNNPCHTQVFMKGKCSVWNFISKSLHQEETIVVF